MILDRHKEYIPGIKQLWKKVYIIGREGTNKHV